MTSDDRYQLFFFRKNETSHLAIYATSDERYVDVNDSFVVGDGQTRAFVVNVEIDDTIL